MNSLHMFDYGCTVSTRDLQRARRMAERKNEKNKKTSLCDKRARKICSVRCKESDFQDFRKQAFRIRFISFDWLHVSLKCRFYSTHQNLYRALRMKPAAPIFRSQVEESQCLFPSHQLFSKLESKQKQLVPCHHTALIHRFSHSRLKRRKTLWFHPFSPPPTGSRV